MLNYLIILLSHILFAYQSDNVFSLSPYIIIDARIRGPAETQLMQLESNDIVNYYNYIIEILKNPNTPSSVALMTLIRLRTSIYARESATRSLLSNRWLSQSEQLRNEIHQVVLSNLNSPEDNFRETCSLIVSEIATIELPHGLWPELLDNLLAVAQNPANDSTMRQSAISIIGLICGELSQDVHSLAKHTDNILNCIGGAMANQNSDLGMLFHVFN